MANQLISDSQVSDALDYLRDTAADAAAAKARVYLLEEQRKSVKAVIMKQYADLPIGAQEREAYASPEYQAHLQKTHDAMVEAETHRGLRVAAEAKIEAWRTMNANYRSMKIG